MKNQIAVIFTTIFLFGCSSTPKTYHIWAGARADKYTENESVPINQQLANSIGGTVTTISGNPNQLTLTGYGGQLGITEQVGHLVTTLSLYLISYPTLSYSFNSSQYGTISESLSITGFGLDSTIGYNIGWFRPGIGYKYESVSFLGTVSGGTSSLAAVSTVSTSETLFMIGPSLAIDIPIFGILHLVAQGDYRFPVVKGTDVASANSMLLQAGIRIIEWHTGGGKDSGNKSAKK